MTAPFLDGNTVSPLLSLGAALVIGAAFGATLEQAGLGSARKVSGQFYFTDFTVFKVMFSAIVTAMLGIFWGGRIGILDVGRIYVPETFLLPQLVGGIIFGAGFVLAGLCPGTSCVAAATGRIDGLMVVGGMFSGVLLTGIAFASLRPLYESTALGTRLLPATLHLPEGIVIFAIAAMAVTCFAFIARLEKARR